MKRIEVLGLQTVPEIKEGDNLDEIIIKCADNEIGGLQDKDIVVLTVKIVSKALGRTRKLDEVKPGRQALAISVRTNKDAKWLQMIFDEGHKILAIVPLKGLIEQYIYNISEDGQRAMEVCEHERSVCITIGRNGRIHTCDAGIDGSNHPAGIVSLLPENPDKEAKKIREQIKKLCGREVAVILADTEMIPFGTMDFAVGSSGIEPISRMFSKPDLFGKPKFGGIDLTACELTAASALLFGQAGAGVPVAVIRGYEYEINETANITNTLISETANGSISRVIRETLRVTSYTKPFLKRFLMQAASCFF